MNNKIIGRFIPVSNFNRGSTPFNVITRESSTYMPPSWEGIREGGEKYHVTECAWRFESMEWDGEGLPPVGVECEMSYAGDEWHKCVIIAKGEEQIIYQVHGGREFSGHRNNYKFRPIRPKADKKRDETIKALKFSFGAFDVNGLADMVYHAIAAGKIPHIRID